MIDEKVLIEKLIERRAANIETLSEGNPPAHPLVNLGINQAIGIINTLVKENGG